VRDEFVFSIGGHKLYTIQDLDYFDDILIAENARFWGNVTAYFQKQYRDKEEPELIPVATLPLNDAIKKFG
jgi:hypothetical protein